MSERTEWPSPEKLAQLRESGEACSSPISTRCASSAAGLAALALTLAREQQELSKLLHKFQTLAGPEIFQPLLGVALRLLIIPSVCAFIAGLACSLFQTRFLVAPIRLAPRLMRNSAYRTLTKAMAWQAFVYLIVVIATIFGATVIYWLVGFDLLNCFNQPLNEIAQRLSMLWRSMLNSLIILAVVLSILAAFLANLLFRRRHRMTRAEMLSQREG